MSRGVTYDPVCANQTSSHIARPPVVTAASVPFDPVSRTIVGTQTAVPDIPPTG